MENPEIAGLVVAFSVAVVVASLASLYLGYAYARQDFRTNPRYLARELEHHLPYIGHHMPVVYPFGSSENMRRFNLERWVDEFEDSRIINQHRQKRGDPMRRRKYSIELKAELDDAQHAAMKHALQQNARRIITAAALLGQHKAQIAIFSDDFMVGTEDIPVLEPGEMDGDAS